MTVVQRWLTLAAGLIAVVLLLMPIQVATREGRSLMDAAHAPLFAVLTLLMMWQLGGAANDRPGRRAIAIWLAIVGFSGIMELAQNLSGRSASWADLLANLLGATAGLALSAIPRTRGSVRRGALVVVAGVILAAAWYRPGLVFADVYRQWRQFPQLADFEDPRELMRWYFQGSRAQRSRDFATSGEWGLRIDLEPCQYPGATLHWPPADWTGYRTLVIDLKLSPGPPLELIVKVQDRRHNNEYEDRFERPFRLTAGTHELRIPLDELKAAPVDRPMDLSRIAVLQFFSVDLKSPRTIFLDNIRLER